MSFRAEALAKLRPNARWQMFGDDITWTDVSQTQPTEEEIVAKATELENAEPLRLLRIERNAKLAETDWTQMADSSLTDSVKAEWVTYRTALRDITDSATSLDDVTWPEKP
jgi:hypothetical protein